MVIPSIWTSVAASASATAVPYLDKTDFLKLQNGRSIPLDYKQANKFITPPLFFCQLNINLVKVYCLSVMYVERERERATEKEGRDENRNRSTLENFLGNEMDMKYCRILSAPFLPIGLLIVVHNPCCVCVAFRKKRIKINLIVFYLILKTLFFLLTQIKRLTIS